MNSYNTYSMSRWLSLFSALAATALMAKELRPGVWPAQTFADLPLPTAGYQAYLVGELHGLAENADFQIHYLQRLNALTGLRDVAIEEDSVYEREAQRFIDGVTVELPGALCLRAGILHGIRTLNKRLGVNERIRIHLVDVDSPATAIHRHLEILKEELRAATVRVPAPEKVGRRGLKTIARLRQFPNSDQFRAEFRTVELSIRALRQGFAVDVGEPKGSPYLESREEAIASNIIELTRSIAALLVLYGSDHVSRSARKDGGPKRNQLFKPMALRLRESGIRAHSLITFPLEAEVWWRGRGTVMPWKASDAKLSSGESFEHLLSSSPGTDYLFVDRTREASRLPSEDISKMDVDAFVLFKSAKAMNNSCQSSAR